MCLWLCYVGYVGEREFKGHGFLSVICSPIKTLRTLIMVGKQQIYAGSCRSCSGTSLHLCMLLMTCL